jgi:hypothetical protein
MVPHLRIIGEVEGYICDMPVLRGAPHSEVAFTPVEPQHGVAHPVVFRELHFVRGGESVILFIIMAAVIWRPPIFLGMQGALSAEEASVRELLLLALLRNCHLEGGHLITKGD